MDIESLITNFLFHCSVERRLSRNTVDAYKQDLRSLTKFSKKKAIQELLSVENLKAYLMFILETENLSVNTARRRLACFKSFSRYTAVAMKLDNPFSTWSPKLKRPQLLPKSLSITEFGQLISHSEDFNQINIQTLFCITLLATTGLRVSELCSIRLADVSSDGGLNTYFRQRIERTHCICR